MYVFMCEHIVCEYVTVGCDLCVYWMWVLKYLSIYVDGCTGCNVSCLYIYSVVVDHICIQCISEQTDVHMLMFVSVYI